MYAVKEWRKKNRVHSEFWNALRKRITDGRQQVRRTAIWTCAFPIDFYWLMLNGMFLECIQQLKKSSHSHKIHWTKRWFEIALNGKLWTKCNGTFDIEYISDLMVLWFLGTTDDWLIRNRGSEKVQSNTCYNMLRLPFCTTHGSVCEPSFILRAKKKKWQSIVDSFE